MGVVNRISAQINLFQSAIWDQNLVHGLFESILCYSELNLKTIRKQLVPLHPGCSLTYDHHSLMITPDKVCSIYITLDRVAYTFIACSKCSDTWWSNSGLWKKEKITPSRLSSTQNEFLHRGSKMCFKNSAGRIPSQLRQNSVFAASSSVNAFDAIFEIFDLPSFDVPMIRAELSSVWIRSKTKFQRGQRDLKRQHSTWIFEKYLCKSDLLVT